MLMISTNSTRAPIILASSTTRNTLGGGGKVTGVGRSEVGGCLWGVVVGLQERAFSER